ncbi:putative bifunctional diguanylate cyclase/phosphodiesterase (plasmid) [Aureimonas ureilytica]|uniref:putative bifunctional diguanylate cyclase/phosphodiesterase n=1 Tax=Aureimonas ureilytica TaxID=401562 RepID=UPI003CF83E64
MPEQDSLVALRSDPRPVDLATALDRVETLERANADLQARLCEAEIRYHFASALSNQITWVTSPTGEALDFSPLWMTLTGMSLEESVGNGWAAAMYPEDREPVFAIWAQALKTGEVAKADYRLRLRDGELRWFHVRAAPRRAADGSIMCWYGKIEDIHDRKVAEDALKASEAMIRSVLESTTDYVFVVDRDWRITFMNTRWADYVRQERNGRIGDVLWDLFPEDRGGILDVNYHQALASGKPVHFEAYIARADIWLDLNVCPMLDGLAVFFRDVTDTKRARDDIARLAHQDTLTGLANRMVLNNELEGAFQKRGECRTGLLMLDLDLFKEVNDTLGHAVGDELLRGVAARLKRELDEGDVFARLGGDEFAVIHRLGSDETSVQALAERLMAGFTDCFFIDGIAIKLAASIGTALSSPAHESANDLLKAADIALYRAKEGGRGAIRAFDDGMADRLHARQTMKIDLEVALVLGELRLVYQPLLDIASGRIAGAEALLRWRHPSKGEISPAEFIPLAEDTGLIVEIGDWVLRQACIQAASWPSDRTIAVNLSPVQIRDETLPERVQYALSYAGIDPSRLELEITESVLLHDSERNLAMLHALRKIGVRIALDDFGTGYSSLSYLRHFPFDKLKLDRCFVGDIGVSPQTEAIIRAAGEMGRALTMTTTAEGVETQEQLDWLRLNGWTQSQGWLTGRPMEAGAIKDRMAGCDAAHGRQATAGLPSIAMA